MQTQIYQYVRDRKGQLVGVLMANRFGDKVYITGSKVNLAAGDVFNKQFGIQLAQRRFEKMKEDAEYVPRPLPHSFRQDIDVFVNRCKRYFKDCTVFSPNQLVEIFNTI